MRENSIRVYGVRGKRWWWMGYILLWWMGSRTHAAVKVLARVDTEVITNYDIDNAWRLFSRLDRNFAKKFKDKMAFLLGDYMSMVKMAEVAKANGVKLETGRGVTLWQDFAVEFGISDKFKDFCEKNDISEKFLYTFLENKALWSKFLEERISSLKLDEQLLQDYMEYEAGKKAIYNLTMMTIDYPHEKQQKLWQQKLEELRSSLNDNPGTNFRDMLTLAQEKEPKLKMAKVEEIKAIAKGDLNSDILQQVENLRKGDISVPFCRDRGKTDGRCFLLRVDDKKINIDFDQENKTKIFHRIFNITLENKTENLLQSYSGHVKVLVSDGSTTK
jgi:hypothetical protein